MREWFANPLVFHLAVGAAIVAAFWILTGARRWALAALGRRVFARTETVLDDRILEVELTLIARASSYTTQWGAETELRERAYRAFLEHGISAPVPRRLVQVEEKQAHAS
jgi:small-conductance mechanosensitive channel